jgi:protein ImuB
MFAALYSPRPVADEALLVLARDFTPRAEGAGPIVILDLAGLGRLWPSARALAEALQAAAVARGLGALHIAIAPTRIGAGLIAHGRAGVNVIAERALADAVSRLPLAWLDLPADARQTLRRWGVRTIGQLAALPAPGLVARFGAVAARWQRAARGEDDRPLIPTPPPEPLDMRLELDWPIEGLEPLAFVLGPVLEALMDKLERHGQSAASLALELSLVNGHMITRALRTAAPTLDTRTWRTLLLLELESHPPSDAIQTITVTATPTEARSTQFSLLEGATPSPERLSEMMARLAEWTRDGRAGSPALLPTHRPGVFAMTRFEGGASSEAPPLAAPMRMALRVYRPPRPIEVARKGGVPVAVVGSHLHADVLCCAGPWRASGDWWDATWSREEWDVELRGCGLYRIFRDRLRDAWFVEGELD